jgi:hypothetical protein
MADQAPAAQPAPRPFVRKLSLRTYRPNPRVINEALWGPGGQPPHSLPYETDPDIPPALQKPQP